MCSSYSSYSRVITVRVEIRRDCKRKADHPQVVSIQVDHLRVAVAAAETTKLLRPSLMDSWTLCRHFAFASGMPRIHTTRIDVPRRQGRSRCRVLLQSMGSPADGLA